MLALAGIILASASTKKTLAENVYADPYILEKGADLPVIWLYYDTNDVNSRRWADFGAHSSNVLNISFLNLCYGTIIANNGHKYRVEIIGGLAGVAERLTASDMPSSLREGIERIGDAEYNWIRAAILAKYGGLWLDPTVVALKPFGELPKDQLIFFGTDKDQTYAGPRGTATPSLNAIWVPQPQHPVMVAWRDAARRRLEQRSTGAAARQDEKWDFVSFAADNPAVTVIPSAELARNKRTGKRLQLEDLLAAGQEGNLPFDVPGEAIYVPVPWKELRDRRAFGWFLRMSESQIMESDLVIRDLLTLSNTIPTYESSCTT
jgi:hypothetical protein